MSALLTTTDYDDIEIINGVRMALNIELPADKIADLREQYGATELALFGSCVRGDGTSESDNRIGRRSFKTAWPKVELVPADSLKWVIRDRYLNEARIIDAAQ